MDHIQELREIVNPVFNTAKACVQLNAAAGDEDSRQLLGILGFDRIGNEKSDKAVPPEVAEQVKRLFPVYAVYTESRFQTVNKLIETLPDRIVVDLPCGYTSRGIKMSHQGRTYHGFDLPAVIDVIGPAAAKIYGGDRNIHYDAVDATNYESMEAPLEGEKNLLITTEGLLMYFTQQELEEVFSNIRRLLQKHGGSWVIVDRAYYTYDQTIAGVLLDHDPAMVALYAAITQKAAGAVADVKFYDNVFFKNTDQEIIAFIEKMGFELRQICAADYLPDQLGSLKVMPQAEAGVREVFRDMVFWELTVKEKSGAEVDKDLPFAVESEFCDGTFTAKIQGRMDTITAPELLEKFQAVDGVNEIEIDASKMAYVSSAGLRVLLMMCKSLKDKSRFRMTGINDNVKEILEVTGFDQLLL